MKHQSRLPPYPREAVLFSTVSEYVRGSWKNTYVTAQTNSGET